MATLLIATASFLPRTSAAQDAPDTRDEAEPTVILRGLLETAMQSNPSLSAAASRVEGAEYHAAASDGLPDPMLGFGWSPRPIETRGGEQRFRVSAEQALPFFGKRRLRREAGSADAERLDRMRYGAEASVAREVKTAFWGLYETDRSLDIAWEEKTLLEEISEAVRAKYVTGKGSQANLLQIDLLRTGNRNRILILQGNRAEDVDRLSGTVGQQVEVPRLAELRENPTLPDSATLRGQALESNPQILAAEEAVRREELKLKLAGRDYYPDVKLNAGWLEVKDNGMGLPVSGRDSWAVGVGVMLPVFRGDIHDREQAQDASLRAARQDRDDVRNRVLARVNGLAERIESLEESVNLYRTGLLPQAQSTYEAALGGYTTGELEFADLILAEQSLLRVELELHRTVAGRQKGVAELEALLGTDGRR